MPPVALPPFPSDLPTADLVTFSLADLEDGASRPLDPSLPSNEELCQACCSLGFFYLDLRTSAIGARILEHVAELHEIQQIFFALPHEEKDEFGQDKVDPFYSYRWSPCQDGIVDGWGRRGRREMYNLRVDDLFDMRPVALKQHSLFQTRRSLLSQLATDCRQVLHLILGILELGLGLASGSLNDLHRDNSPYGDFISVQHRAHEPYDEKMVVKGEHTDFGSITMLFNWLGGLQIRRQDTSASTQTEGTTSAPPDWVWVKPITGSCVVNLGDSLVKLTAGKLRSNIHRVAPAPGPQAGLPRYSLVYFAHPNDDVNLQPVASSLDGAQGTAGGSSGPIITAAEWVTRRSLGDLRGVFTWASGIEWRDNTDAVLSQTMGSITPPSNVVVSSG